MKSILSNKQRYENLRRLACECIERKHSGCNVNCDKCTLNISIYLDDPRDAVLILTKAELDYEENVQYQNDQIQRQIEYQKEINAENIKNIIGYILAIFFTIILPIILIQSCINSCSS